MKKQPRAVAFLFGLGLAIASQISFVSSALAGADPKVTMELVQLVTPPENYQAMISQMTTQMLASMQQTGAKVPPDAQSKMALAVTDALPYNDLAQWTVEIYSARFSTEEIKQLIAFYKTPVGKKAAKLLPEISGEVGKKLGPVLMQRLPASMKKVGLAP
jgi:hypothetical protein